MPVFAGPNSNVVVRGDGSDGHRAVTGERTTTRAGAARLRDVAQAAGVSVKTVSNGVNGTARVADETPQLTVVAVANLGAQ